MFQMIFITSIKKEKINILFVIQLLGSSSAIYWYKQKRGVFSYFLWATLHNDWECIAAAALQQQPFSAPNEDIAKSIASMKVLQVVFFYHLRKNYNITTSQKFYSKLNLQHSRSLTNTLSPNKAELIFK